MLDRIILFWNPIQELAWGSEKQPLLSAWFSSSLALHSALLGSFLNFLGSHLLSLFIYIFFVHVWCVCSPASKWAPGLLLVLGLNVLPLSCILLLLYLMMNKGWYNKQLQFLSFLNCKRWIPCKVSFKTEKKVLLHLQSPPPPFDVLHHINFASFQKINEKLKKNDRFSKISGLVGPVIQDFVFSLPKEVVIIRILGFDQKKILFQNNSYILSTHYCYLYHPKW